MKICSIRWESVDKLLVDMGWESIPQLRVLNKTDRASELEYKLLAKQAQRRADFSARQRDGK